MCVCICVECVCLFPVFRIINKTSTEARLAQVQYIFCYEQTEWTLAFLMGSNLQTHAPGRDKIYSGVQQMSMCEELKNMSVTVLVSTGPISVQPYWLGVRGDFQPLYLKLYPSCKWDCSGLNLCTLHLAAAINSSVSQA